MESWLFGHTNRRDALKTIQQIRQKLGEHAFEIKN